MRRTIQLALACVAVLVATTGQVQAGFISLDWHAEDDPTARDSNGDMTPDWVVRGGGAFNGAIASSIWSGGQFLDTRPLSTWDTAFHVDMRWRVDGTSTSAFDSLFWVNIDPDGAGAQYAPVYFSLTNPTGLSQTLTARHKPGNTEAVLATFTGLGNDFLVTKFAFDGAGNVGVSIGGVFQSSHAYATNAAQNGDAFATIGGFGAMRLDYINTNDGMTAAAVPEPSTFVLAGLGLLGLGCFALRKKYRRA